MRRSSGSWARSTGGRLFVADAAEALVAVGRIGEAEAIVARLEARVYRKLGIRSRAELGAEMATPPDGRQAPARA